MVLFPSYVEVDDFSWTCPRFEFDGWQGPGQCFLRIEIKERRAVFICAQLINDRRARIGSSEGNIRERVLTLLFDKGVIRATRTPGVLDRFRPKAFEEKQRKDVLWHFDRHSVWIQHCPEASMEWDECAYAISNFSRSRFMLYPSKEPVIEDCRIDPALLAITDEDLDVRFHKEHA